MTTSYKAKNVNLILVVILVLSAQGCSDRNSCIDISLPESQRIEDTAVGWWIKGLVLHYGNQSKYITTQMHIRLNAEAKLIDKYINDRKGQVTIWEYYNNNTPIIIKEEVNEGSDGQTIWMSYEYPYPGIIWSKIIPADFQRLKPNRKYEHAVTIDSAADKGARVFLFGWGEYCTRISIF